MIIFKNSFIEVLLSLLKLMHIPQSSHLSPTDANTFENTSHAIVSRQDDRSASDTETDSAPETVRTSAEPQRGLTSPLLRAGRGDRVGFALPHRCYPLTRQARCQRRRIEAARRSRRSPAAPPHPTRRTAPCCPDARAPCATGWSSECPRDGRCRRSRQRREGVPNAGTTQRRSPTPDAADARASPPAASASPRVALCGQCGRRR